MVCLRVANQHGKAEREIRDIRERAAEADSQGRQYRQHLTLKALSQLGALLVRERAQTDDFNPVLSELPQQRLSHQMGLALDMGNDAFVDLVDRLRWRIAATLAVNAGVDLVEQAGDANHEEFIKV